MHLMDWAQATEQVSRVLGPIGTLAAGFAAVAAAALVFVWRALRIAEGRQLDRVLDVVGANTESHERNATAHRDGAIAIVRLGETMDRLGQTMRDTEEQRRHNLDLILQSRVGISGRRRTAKGRPRG